MRTIILSDTHFGAPGRRTPSPASLRPIIQRADRLVLNGDVAELQAPALRADAARAVLELQSICDELDIELDLISGNHDAYLNDQRHLTLADGQILVTHGDVLHPAVVPWVDDAAGLEIEARDGLRQLDDDHRDTLEGRLLVSQYVGHTQFLNSSHSERLISLLLHPSRVRRICQYWKHAPTAAALLAARYAPQTKFIVFGHSHRQGVWPIGWRTVINTGSFHFPGRPRAVVIDDQTLTVHKVKRQRDQYTLSPKPIFSATLNDVQAERAAA